MTGNKTKIFVFVINTSQMNNRSLCPGKYSIRDPYTHKCLKLSLKGTLYNRYVVPFILGDSSFLYLFSKEDQQKFILFLKKHYLLPAHYTYHSNIRNNKSTVTNSRTTEQKWQEFARRSQRRQQLSDLKEGAKWYNKLKKKRTRRLKKSIEK